MIQNKYDVTECNGAETLNTPEMFETLINLGLAQSTKYNSADKFIYIDSSIINPTAYRIQSTTDPIITLPADVFLNFISIVILSSDFKAAIEYLDTVPDSEVAHYGVIKNGK